MLEPLFEKTDIFKIEEFNSELIQKVNTNGQQKTILLSSEDFEKNTELLNKILPAIGFGDAAKIVLDTSLSKYFPIHRLIDDIDNQTVISFGIKPKNLALPAHLRDNILYHLESYSLSFAPSIQEMSVNNEAKKSFWTFAKSALVDQN